LKVVKLNTDTAPEIANRFGVQGIPLLVVLRDGAEVDRLAGAAPRPHIERWLEQQLAAEAPTR
jgi:thioredoxin-like negative regulator of GroEL